MLPSLAAGLVQLPFGGRAGGKERMKWFGSKLSYGVEGYLSHFEATPGG